MTKPDLRKAKPVEDYVVTQHGSGPFRAFNFELYAKPTGLMRLAAYAGTTAFVGTLGYMMYEKSRLEAIANKDRGQA
ncbi:hypothetical protein ABBQ38_004957 [Trebouxia sp. C0009 RCD-2024]